MKIKFHGFLKRLCPKEYYEIEAKSAAEAIRGLTNQLKQLRRVGANRWSCRVKECPKRDDLYVINEGLTELNLYPDYTPAGGGGNMGVTQMIIGAVIIVAAVVGAFFTGGATLAALGSLSATWGAISAGFAASTMLTASLAMGAALVLGGLAQTLQKVPKVKSDEDSERNKYFSSGKNTSEIGTRIAIGYGKYKVAGQILSINQESY